MNITYEELDQLTVEQLEEYRDYLLESSGGYDD